MIQVKINSFIDRRFPRPVTGFLACVAIFAIGCGTDGPEKVIVSGAVTYEGKPLPVGKVLFFPIEGTAGPVSTATIQDGQYRVDNKGGVPVGKHQVKIEGYHRPTTAPPGVDLEELGPEQYLPAKFNVRSELQAEFVSGEGTTTRHFTLSK